MINSDPAGTPVPMHVSPVPGTPIGERVARMEQTLKHQDEKLDLVLANTSAIPLLAQRVSQMETRMDKADEQPPVAPIAEKVEKNATDIEELKTRAAEMRAYKRVVQVLIGLIGTGSVGTALAKLFGLSLPAAIQ